MADQSTIAGGSARHTASLAARLALSVALVLVVGGTAVALAAFAYGQQAAEQAFDRLLIGAADQIAGSISIQGGRVLVDIPASAFELLALAPDDRLLYAVLDPEGRLVTGYEGVGRPAARFATGNFGGEPVRLIRVSRQFAERDYAGTVDVVVGQTTLRATRWRAKSPAARSSAWTSSGS